MYYKNISIRLVWGLQLDMVAQLKLDLEILPVEVRKKRIRYKVPTYKKFYSIWQYDRLKFRELLNVHLKDIKTSPFKNQWEILDLCYIRDEKGKKLRDCDEAHIFRAGTLQRVYEKIFDYTGVMFIDNPGAWESFKVIKENGLNIYPCEGQAEIENSWQLSIEKRLKLHIKLLRLLREGFSVSESILKLKGYY